MTAHTTTHSTLLTTFLPTVGSRVHWRNLVLAFAATGLITLAAKIQIPFYPVPLTMQTFMVIVLAMALGWRLATLTLVLYLAEGAMGLPVFAGTPEKGLGFAYMIGPTGGYLLGFVLAAGVCGWLAQRGWDRRHSSTLAAMCIGHLLIFVPGLLWLGFMIGWDKPVLELGLYPFLYGTGLKIILGTLALRSAWVLTGKRKHLDLR